MQLGGDVNCCVSGGRNPRIELVIGDECQSVGLVRIKTQRVSERTGTYRFYGTWQIPDLPGTPRNLRNATTPIRHNS